MRLFLITILEQLAHVGPFVDIVDKILVVLSVVCLLNNGCVPPVFVKVV